ncbi:MAG: hypothetical protein U0X39_04655 [Bacteroidales bacterium]
MLSGGSSERSRSFIPEKNGHTHTSDLVRQISDMNKGIYLEEELENAKPRTSASVLPVIPRSILKHLTGRST